MILSMYISNDGRARAEVHLIGIKLRIVCYLNDDIVAEVSACTGLEEAENFAEDFVLNKEKEENGYNIKQYSVLYRSTESNERNRQSSMA